MDVASRRVALHGLRLLHRGRELRDEEAAREVARRRRDFDLAIAEIEQARARLKAHRDFWRAQERELMGPMEIALPASRLALRRRHLERLADEAVRLADALAEAEAARAHAAEALDTARAVLAARRRETCKAAEAIGQAERRLRREAATAEQREAEDATIDRFATRSAALRHGAAP